MKFRLYLLALVLFEAICGSLTAQVYPGVATGLNCDRGAGFQFGGPSAPWNQSILSASVDANSATWESSYTSVNLHVNFGNDSYGGVYGIPYNCVDSSQTGGVNPLFVYDDNDSDHTLYPLASSMLLEDGYATCPFDPNNFDADGSDHHILAFDIFRGFDYEIWRANRCAGSWIGANGAVWDATTFTQRTNGRTSADAAGLPILALLATYDQCVTHPTYVTINSVSSPTCGHALRYTMPRIRVAGYNSGGVPIYMPPAAHSVAGGGGVTSSGYDIDGMRIRLPAAYDISALSPQAQTIANTMKAFGMYLADGGGSFFLIGTQDARWNFADIYTLQTIAGGSFELLTQSPTYYPGSFYGDANGYPAPVNNSALFPGVTAAPTGALPTNSTPTASNPVVVAGQSVTLTRTPGTGANIEYIANGPPIRPADTAVTFKPQSSAPLILTSCNAFGCTTAAPVPLTVLTPPFVGVVSAVGLR